MSPSLLAWLLASTITNVRDRRADLAVRHEALFDDPRPAPYLN